MSEKSQNGEFQDSQPWDGLIAGSERNNSKHLHTQGRVGTMPSHEIVFINIYIDIDIDIGIDISIYIDINMNLNMFI